MQIHPTAIVHPSAELAEGVEVGAHAFIGPNVKIGEGTVVQHHANIDQNTTIGAGCRIWPYASVGTDPQDLKFAGETTHLVIGDRVRIREFATLNRGTGHGGGLTQVGNDCLLMAYTHVAHDCRVGNGIIMSNSATLGGHVVVHDRAILSGLCAVHQFCRVGYGCFIGGMSAVTLDQPPFCLCQGNYCYPRGLNLVGLRRAGLPKDNLNALKEAFNLVFRTRTPLKEAVAQARQKCPDLPEVRVFLEFLETSERGVARDPEKVD